MPLSTPVRDTGAAESARHHLAPLVLVPYGYSTYRGSS
jgi:5-hydroxyisourate hydrolase-like protein (transthyretin family)